MTGVLHGGVDGSIEIAILGIVLVPPGLGIVVLGVLFVGAGVGALVGQEPRHAKLGAGDGGVLGAVPYTPSRVFHRPTPVSNVALLPNSVFILSSMGQGQRGLVVSCPFSY